jgi:hypothetical protein
MMLRQIILSLALINSGFLFCADQTVKIPYYIVHLHNFIGKDILVPKSCFDKAVKTAYLIEGQHQVFGYEKKIIGFDVVDVMFLLMPDKDYQPGDTKKKFTVDCRVYTPSAMNIDKHQFKTKHQALKFIEDNARAQLKKDLGPAADAGAVMY